MNDVEAPTPRCGRCKDPFLPEQEGQKYCSVRCREAAKKRRQRFKLRRGKDAGELLGPLGTGVERDASLSELHENSTAPKQLVSPDADYIYEPDEFGYVDGLLDSEDDDRTVLDSMPGQGTADDFRRLRADVTSRLEKVLQKYEYTIKANFQGDFRLAAQRDPRIRAIVSEYQKEFEAIDAAERNYLKADAIDQASKPWVRQANLDRAKGYQNTIEFGRDMGKPTRLTGGVPMPGRATGELVAGYPGQNNVFGSDSEVWRRSSVARELGNRVLSPDGWM